MKQPIKTGKNGVRLLALAAAFLVLILLYFTLLAPLLSPGSGAGGSSTPTVSTGEGEGTGITPGTLLMFPRVERVNMLSIEVANGYNAAKGDYENRYTFLKDVNDENGDGDANDFIIKGFAANVYDEELFSDLVVDTGYSACLGKLDTLDFSQGAEEVYAVYGLSAADHPSYYVLTTTEGLTYRVYIGHRTPDGNYYARLEGREAIYVLYAALDDSVLAPLAHFVEPALTLSGESSYAYAYIQNFAIFRDSALKDVIFGGGTPDGPLSLDPYVMFTYMKAEERDVFHTQSVYAMLAPSTVYTAADARVDAALSRLPGLTGSETLKLGISDADFAEGGLLSDLAYTLYYEMPYNITYDENEDPVAGRYIINILFVTARGADGSYNVGSISYEKGKEDKILYNMIAKVAYEDLFFVEYSLFDWIEGRMLGTAIDNVSGMEISSSKGDYIFDIEGDGTTTTTVTELLSGYRWFYHERNTPFKLNDKGYCEDIQQFRQLYLLALNLQYEGDIATDTGMTDEEIAAFMRDDAACILTLSLTLEDGREVTYRFFPYSERHAMVSLSGDGIEGVTTFYTSSAAVRRIATAAHDLMHGIYIDAEHRYSET